MYLDELCRARMQQFADHVSALLQEKIAEVKGFLYNLVKAFSIFLQLTCELRRGVDEDSIKLLVFA